MLPLSSSGNNVATGFRVDVFQQSQHSLLKSSCTENPNDIWTSQIWIENYPKMSVDSVLSRVA